jgi:hypothetical protein
MSTSQYKPEEDPVYLLFKCSMETAGPKQKEGYSLRLRVEKGGAVIDFETSAPPVIMGGRGGRSPPAVFDKAKAMAVVQEYPDLLTARRKTVDSPSQRRSTSTRTGMSSIIS